MKENPYKYHGLLDPVKDKDVCIRREKELRIIKEGIERGDYCAIFAPSQMGKTTLLRQIKHEFSNSICIYLNLQLCPNEAQPFYNWLQELILELSKGELYQSIHGDNQSYTPELTFFGFLKNIEANEGKKVILLFDEIGRLSIDLAKSFLGLWRKVFHVRNDQPEFNKYIILIAGGGNLISLTLGPTSPFNVTERIYLGEFSKEQSYELMNVAQKKLNIEFNADVKELLFSFTAGHPQLLQHLCFLLTERALLTGKKLTTKDIAKSVDTLFSESDNLLTLREELKTQNIPENLIKQLLVKERIPFNRVKQVIAEAELTGILVNKDEYCVIRNKIYERLLREEFGKRNEDVKIFLSYATQDEKQVETIYEQLKNYGFKPWMANKDILPGEVWKRRIEKSIQTSDFFAACLSTSSINKRGFLQREIKDALDIWQQKLEEDIYVIPIKLEECNVPDNLQRFQWVELYKKDCWNKLLASIEEGIKRLNKQ